MSRSFSDVIDLFGGPAAFAREVGMTPGAAKKAKRRNSIAPHWYVPTSEAARRLGIAGVNEIALAQIASQRECA